MKITIPEKVELIIDTLMEQGFEAYAVGGCVRDTLLGREPGDWDITTSAKPEEVKALFRRTIDTGIEHGTVTVMFGKEGYEVTTYRIDGEYEDNRHPKSVEFTSDLVEDLKRRDFTINAMAYNHQSGIVDEFDGLEDLQKGIIRCVGSAHQRFDEDALRILRAIRFAGQLGFSIEEETKVAIQDRAHLLKNISAERIRTELSKLLISKKPELLLTGKELGITKVILPVFDQLFEVTQENPHHIYDVGMHTMESLKIMNDIVSMEQCVDSKHHMILSYTMLLHDVGKIQTKTIDEQGIAHFYGHPKISSQQAKKILKGLKFDNYTIDKVTHLVNYHDYRIECTDKAVRRAASKIGVEDLNLLFLVQEADIKAQNPVMQEEKLEKLERLRQLYDEMIRDACCVTLKELKVNGKMLIELGFEPGKEIGVVLSKLLEQVIEQPELNEEQVLLDIAKQYLVQS